MVRNKIGQDFFEYPIVSQTRDRIVSCPITPGPCADAGTAMVSLDWDDGFPHGCNVFLKINSGSWFMSHIFLRDVHIISYMTRNVSYTVPLYTLQTHHITYHPSYHIICPLPFLTEKRTLV